MRVATVVRCLLFLVCVVARCLLFVACCVFVRWLLCVASCGLTGDCYVLFVGCRLSCIVRCLVLAGSSCSLFAVCRLLFVVCRLLSGVYDLPFAA